MLTTAPQPATAQHQDPPTKTPSPRSDEVTHMIAEAAYFIAEGRGFEPGHDVDDWLQAEAEVFDRLAEGAR